MALPSPRRRRIRRALLAVGALLLAAAGLAFALARPWSGVASPADKGEGITRGLERKLPPECPAIRFEEVARNVGVVMEHGAGPRSSLLPEDMGSGAALEDFDKDGDLDLFVVNFAGGVGPGRAETARPPADGATHRLFRNEGGRFTDVTLASGAGYSDFGIGVAAGDYDGDGHLDLYVTCYGKNRLLRNLGALRFEDATDRAQASDPGFGAGAAFGDVDRDGDLDLYVCNYVEFQWDGRKGTPSPWGAYTLPYTINPSSFPPAKNRFYRNQGDGTFVEEAETLGIADATGRSLSAVFADFSGDGWPDLYVLNDVSKNAYFENRGDGTFVDRSEESLAADYRGAMGNAVADFDGDGDLDLFITQWIAQENAMYVNLRAERAAEGHPDAPTAFSDMAEVLGLGQIALDYVGWGTAFCDYDLDGLLDIALVNGSTMEVEGDASRLEAQRPLLFWHRGRKGFFETGAISGAVWRERWNARGLVDGDLDGDGDLDFVVTPNRGPVRILRNAGTSNHWLRIRLRSPGKNRFAAGAWVKVTAEGRTCLQEMGAGTSYLCHRPLELTFGLGKAMEAAQVEVRWPDGQKTTLARVKGDRVVILTPEGEVPVAGR